MSEESSSKASKLAAARKKLKQFQVKSSRASPTASPLPPATTTTAAAAGSSVSDFVPIKQMKMDSDSVPNDSSSVIIVPEDSKESDEKDSTYNQTRSSVESLRQITMQLNGLVSETGDMADDDYDPSTSSVAALELRNQELASLLETQRMTSEKLRDKVESLKKRLTSTESRVKVEKEEGDDRRLRDLSSLREQLQVHIQTIGILVAEKTELQSSLTQTQHIAKQKAGEVEELHGRLKASRQRVTDLEKEVATLAVSSQQQEKINKENSKELDRLKMDIYKVTKTNDELQEHVSQLLEKLNLRLSESEASQLKIEHLERDLVMANVRLKQLSGNETSDGHLEESETLKQKNVDLELEVGNLKDVIGRLMEEKDQANSQYQKYSAKFNQKLQSLTERITELTDSNNDLRQSNSAISEQLALLNDEKDNGKSVETNNHNDQALEELNRQISALKEQEVDLHQRQQSLSNDNSQLSMLLAEKDQQIERLEFSLRDTLELQSNNGRLLEAIESDKVAASRAMAQNKELKKQLEELENGFVKMSNDKLELTEKMMEEQHISKELGERLSQQEEEIKELKEQLSDKEHRLSLVHKSSTELTMQMYQQHQIADRIRHFEAQGQLTEMLQQELNQALERISALSAQNSELRTVLANQTTKVEKPIDDESDADGTRNKELSRKDDIVKSLSASVRQLELERNQLLHMLNERPASSGNNNNNCDAENQGHISNGDVIRNDLYSSNAGNDDDDDDDDADESTPSPAVVSTEEYHNLKQTLTVLEKRFTRTMQDISELADQKQELEHKVIQLQGETETIGLSRDADWDYISLYQMQRHVMKQQVAKKDEYIASVCRDREELKDKLTKLQELVCKLLFERQGKDFSIKGISKLLDKAKLENLRGRGQNYVPILNDMLECINHSTPEKTQVENVSDVTGHAVVTPGDAASLSDAKTDDGKPPVEPESNPIGTAQKIISLISEIGATNLMEKPFSDNFHPCPVCTGSLQTV